MLGCLPHASVFGGACAPANEPIRLLWISTKVVSAVVLLVSELYTCLLLLGRVLDTCYVAVCPRGMLIFYYHVYLLRAVYDE